MKMMISKTGKIDRKERQKLIPVLWKEGKSPLEICDELGYKTPEYVIVVLKKLGLYEDQRIDVPKVLALQKAGWTMDMIEQEFNYRYTQEEIAAAVKKGLHKDDTNQKY